MSATPSSGRYRWAAPGDVNAFFGLMIDNISGMILMAALLTADFRFPGAFVLTNMIPGTAIGVLVGDLIFTVMAFQLARRSGRNDVTAMPLGLDTPSTFGAVYLIIGPAFSAYLQAQASAGQPADANAAARHAWYIGITMMLASGLFKLLCATVSPWIRRHVPRAGLLGSLVAIALVIISFLPLLEIAATPVAGFASLLLVLATLTAHWRLPGKSAALIVAGAVCALTAYFLATSAGYALTVALPLALGLGIVLFVLLTRAGEVPGVMMAVAIGTAIYYGMHLMGYGPGPGPKPASPAAFALPFPAVDWLSWFAAHWRDALGYLPVALPLALATVVGGIDCVESAAAAGDDYPTGPIIAGEGFATLIAGMFGGVIQSTPYIGHPAYKAMGGRAAYTLATALFIGAVGVLGLFGWVFHVLPKAAVFPILVFIGIEITQHSFRATPRKHYPALVLACVPALAYLAFLMVEKLAGETNLPLGGPGATFRQARFETQQWMQTLTVLSSGFIITSLIWGSMLARLIDGAWHQAALVLLLGSVLATFGIIHSPLPGNPVLPPWLVLDELRASGRFEATAQSTPYVWAGMYAMLAGLVVVLGLLGRHARPEPDAEELGVDQPVA